MGEQILTYSYKTSYNSNNKQYSEDKNIHESKYPSQMSNISYCQVNPVLSFI